MKIFQIGFNKCGTASLYHFFKDNGFKSVHWRWGDKNNYKYVALEMKRNYENNHPLLEGMEEFDFYSDMESHLDGFDNEGDDYFPCVHAYIDYFKEIDRQYPNSKFILNIRNVNNWIESRRKHVFSSGRTYLGSCMHHMKMTKKEVLALWENQWDTHINNVLEYFKHRPDDMLLFNIEEGDNGIRIKNFLSEDLNREQYFGLDVSRWKQHNQGLQSLFQSLIPTTENVKKDKRGRVVLWHREDLQ